MKNTCKILCLMLCVAFVLLLCGCDAIERGVEEGIAKANEAEQTDAPVATEAVPEETSEPEKLNVLYGELLDVIVNDNNVAIVKAKISSSFSHKATIEQNYYNVVDLIRNHDFNEYAEIQYWAVADMSDGSEQKVVSFTVPGETVKMISEAEAFADNTLGEYVTDLWVHPSLSE